jgi:hypothetical protein
MVYILGVRSPMNRRAFSSCLNNQLETLGVFPSLCYSGNVGLDKLGMSGPLPHRCQESNLARWIVGHDIPYLLRCNKPCGTERKTTSITRHHVRLNRLGFLDLDPSAFITRSRHDCLVQSLRVLKIAIAAGYYWMPTCNVSKVPYLGR